MLLERSISWLSILGISELILTSQQYDTALCQLIKRCIITKLQNTEKNKWRIVCALKYLFISKWISNK